MAKKKDIGVKMWVDKREIPVDTRVVSSYDENGNLVITFRMRNKQRSEVKLVFDKLNYLDIEDE